METAVKTGGRPKKGTNFARAKGMLWVKFAWTKDGVNPKKELPPRDYRPADRQP